MCVCVCACYVGDGERAKGYILISHLLFRVFLWAFFLVKYRER